jgi:hypothetical protein
MNHRAPLLNLILALSTGPWAAVSSGATALAAESLPPITAGSVPQTLDELWAGYDPSAEPLDVKVIREWAEVVDGKKVKLQMLTFKVGTFKGKESRIAAYFAWPAEAKGKIPGLVQIHGGGQRASKAPVLADASNGYASLSINWLGHDLDDQKPGDAGTDWGALDPTQNNVSHYSSTMPAPFTLDAVPSPRNNNWFILTLTARRALTFLEQQPMVDASRLGVYGHSMGGHITTLVSGIDPRIKAAVPSCGGGGAPPEKIVDRPGSSGGRMLTDPMLLAMIDPVTMLKRINFPILYQGPHNDFNAPLDTLMYNWEVIPYHSKVHFSVSPHFNHRHVRESDAAMVRFFDTWLKSEGKFPTTPELQVSLKTENGIPLATVRPDMLGDVRSVQIYYSINPNALTRFWRSAKAIRSGDTWRAELPVMSTSMPLYVIANVLYAMPQGPVALPLGAKCPPEYLVSSWERMFEPADLQAAGVKPTDSPERLIIADADSWGDGFELGRNHPEHRQASTRKLTDPKWRGPRGATLAFDVRDPEGGKLNLNFEVNQWNAYPDLKPGTYYASAPIKASPEWQTVTFTLSDIKPLRTRDPAGVKSLPPLESWQGITELAIVPSAPGNRGTWPDTRTIHNIRWVGGDYSEPALMPGGKLSGKEFERLFQDNIDDSIRLENQDRTQSGDGR